MKVTYTNHANKKFKDLEKLGIKVTKTLIQKIISGPLHLDTETDFPKIIASGKYYDEHILRVVYRKEGAIIIVVTFYPTRKGRYQS